MRKRDTPFICEAGESYCWTGEGTSFGCVATSTDVSGGSDLGVEQKVLLAVLISL